MIHKLSKFKREQAINENEQGNIIEFANMTLQHEKPSNNKILDNTQMNNCRISDTHSLVLDGELQYKEIYYKNGYNSQSCSVSHNNTELKNILRISQKLKSNTPLICNDAVKIVASYAVEKQYKILDIVFNKHKNNMMMWYHLAKNENAHKITHLFDENEKYFIGYTIVISELSKNKNMY